MQSLAKMYSFNGRGIVTPYTWMKGPILPNSALTCPHSPWVPMDNACQTQEKFFFF